MIKDSFHLHDSRGLVDCAMGRTPADLLIKNGRWVSVQSGEIISGIDVAIHHGRIAFVGVDATHTRGKRTQVIDAQGKYLVPGLLDAHVHVESSMLTISEFIRVIVPHGTSGVFIDPHEIANVFGLAGVRLMVKEAELQPVHVFVQMPSCVPSAPGLETSGASISAEDVAEGMSWNGIIGLGEMMNFPGVSNSQELVHAEMAATRMARKVIGGHYPSPDLGLPFHGYVAGGPSDDHEGTRMEDAVERARQGMVVMMRFGSAWHDVAEQVRAVTEMNLDPRHFVLCSDDVHCETLVSEGHMDRVVRHAIAQNLDPIRAIQMATINTAEYFGVGRDVGCIAPGRYADILLVRDLREFYAEMVLAKGDLIAENGKMVSEKPETAYPAWALNSVHLKAPLTGEDFALRVNHNGKVVANVIGVIENQAPTRHLHLEVQAVEGEVKADLDRDIAMLAVVERHRGTGEVQVGLVQGFGFNQPCAIATTVAHDSHQMIIVGTDPNDMALAANTLGKAGGGQVVVCRGEVVGMVELPIGGLMSNRAGEMVSAQAASVLQGFRQCGCTLNNANMQLSLLALVVIPDLRLSDKGLIDVNRFKVIPVLER